MVTHPYENNQTYNTMSFYDMFGLGLKKEPVAAAPAPAPTPAPTQEAPAAAKEPEVAEEPKKEEE